MKFTKEQKILRHFHRVSKLATFVKKRINRRFGMWLKEWNRDMFCKNYYGDK